MPNGVDLRWDEFPTNARNCFGPNTGSDGQVDTTTSDPPEAPTGQPAPGFIAKRNCDSALNVGTGDAAKEAVLVACAAQVEGTSNDQCPAIGSSGLRDRAAWPPRTHGPRVALP